LSVSSPLTCLAWKALPPAYLSVSCDQKAPTLRQSRDTFGGTFTILRSQFNDCSMLTFYQVKFVVNFSLPMLKMSLTLWVHASKEYSNIYTTRCNVTQFILSGNCSTCFGWYHHPPSGAQTSVSTASGICHAVTATCRYSGR
jgi:hypothetical protein